MSKSHNIFIVFEIKKKGMFWIFIIILIIISFLILFLNWFLPDGTLSKSFKHLFITPQNNQQPHEPSTKLSTESLTESLTEPLTEPLTESLTESLKELLNDLGKID